MEQKAPVIIETRIQEMDPSELVLLEINARYMRHEQFQRLVENIRRDGKLTSVPFGARNEDGTYTVLSGNHRVSAAVEAGLQSIEIMVTDEPLSEKQRLAIQLSHNSISGQDDPVVLKELYKNLNDLDWQLYSGLDDKQLDLLGLVEVPSFSEPSLSFRTITLLFLPEEVEEVAKAFEAAKLLLASNEWWLANIKQYDLCLDSLRAAQQSANIHNVSTGMLVILEVFRDNVRELSKEWLPESHEKAQSKKPHWVPLITVLGNDNVPDKLARRLNRAADSMAGKGLIDSKKRHMMLDVLLENYEEANGRE